MKRKLFYLFILIFIGRLQAQNDFQMSFSNVIGGSDSDKASGIIKINSGDFLTFGYYKSTDGDFSSNHGNYDIFVRKIDLSGNMIWETVLGGSNADYIYDAIEDDNGNFVLVGTSKSNDNDITGNHGNYDILVIKLDASGNLLWQKSFGGSDVDKGTSLLGLTGDEYYILGYSKSIDGDFTLNYGGYDVWLIKIDAMGNIISKQNYGGSSDDKSFKIYTGFSDSYIISAYSKSNDGDVPSNQGNYDFWIFELDNSGTITWNHTFGGSGIDKNAYLAMDLPLSLNKTNVNMIGFNLLGTSNSNDGDIINSYGNFDICMMSIDDSGNVITQKNYGGTDVDFPTSYVEVQSPLAPTYYYFSGYSNSNDNDFNANMGAYDAWIVKTDINGNILESKNFGGSDTDRFTGISLYHNASDMNIFTVGITKSTDYDISGQHGNYDAWFANIISGTSGISEINSNLNKIYPNPASSIVFIEGDKINKINVSDLSGKTILEKKYSDTSSSILDISNLSKGIYLLKIYDGKQINIKKLIVK